MALRASFWVQAALFAVPPDGSKTGWPRFRPVLSGGVFHLVKVSLVGPDAIMLDPDQVLHLSKRFRHRCLYADLPDRVGRYQYVWIEGCSDYTG